MLKATKKYKEESYNVKIARNKLQISSKQSTKMDKKNGTNKRSRDRVLSEDTPTKLIQQRKHSKSTPSSLSQSKDKGTLDNFLGYR